MPVIPTINAASIPRLSAWLSMSRKTWFLMFAASLAGNCSQAQASIQSPTRKVTCRDPSLAGLLDAPGIEMRWLTPERVFFLGHVR